MATNFHLSLSFNIFAIFNESDYEKTIFLFFIFMSGIFVHHAADKEKGRSGMALINPPNSSIYWNFEGNQRIYTSFKNNNVLGVTLLIECGTTDQSIPVVIPPMIAVEHYFDIFDYTPILWDFKISTASTVANVLCYAEWDLFVPDRPGYEI